MAKRKKEVDPIAETKRLAENGRETTRILDVKLTDEELLIRGQELSSEMQALKNLESALADHVSTARAAIKAQRKVVDEIHHVTQTKREKRAVVCVERVDHAKRTAQLVRTDDGEVVDVRTLTDAELQVPLSFPKPEGDLAAAVAADQGGTPLTDEERAKIEADKAADAEVFDKSADPKTH